MSEIRNTELAKTTFEALCSVLDKDGWNYEKNEERLSIRYISNKIHIGGDINGTINDR